MFIRKIIISSLLCIVPINLQAALSARQTHDVSAASNPFEDGLTVFNPHTAALKSKEIEKSKSFLQKYKNFIIGTMVLAGGYTCGKALLNQCKKHPQLKYATCFLLAAVLLNKTVTKFEELMIYTAIKEASEEQASKFSSPKLNSTRKTNDFWQNILQTGTNCIMQPINRISHELKLATLVKNYYSYDRNFKWNVVCNDIRKNIIDAITYESLLPLQDGYKDVTYSWPELNDEKKQHALKKQLSIIMPQVKAYTVDLCHKYFPSTINSLTVDNIEEIFASKFDELTIDLSALPEHQKDIYRLYFVYTLIADKQALKSTHT